LNLKCDESLSNFAFNFNSCLYNKELGRTRNGLAECQFALETESGARQALEGRAASLEHELALLREVLHAPALEGRAFQSSLVQLNLSRFPSWRPPETTEWC